MNKFKEWCKKERVGRAEEGTSQDMFPTNGDSLFGTLVIVIAFIPLIAGLIFLALNQGGN